VNPRPPDGSLCQQGHRGSPGQMATKVMLGKTLRELGFISPLCRGTFPSRRRSSPSAASPMWTCSWDRK
jgi:hypothetical protein